MRASASALPEKFGTVDHSGGRDCKAVLGELRSVKHEGYRLIPASALVEFARRLEETAQESAVA